MSEDRECERQTSSMVAQLAKRQSRVENGDKGTVE